MAKLCVHHQRQIIDAIGFLQTEVKALSSGQQDSNSTLGIQRSACSTAKYSAVTPEKSCPEQGFPTESTPKSEIQDVSHPIPSSCAIKKDAENAVLLKTSAGSAVDLCSPGSGIDQTLGTHTTNPLDVDNNHHGDHAPLKMKIMTSNVADGKKLSCVLNTSLSSPSEHLEDRDGHSDSPGRPETHSARLSSSVKRHSQSSHTHQARQRATLGHAKDTPRKLFPVHMTIPSDSPRTARKTIRIPDQPIRGLPDPDLGQCDIVFIDKPITECFKERRRSMLPRRNARKSTRGHMYSDEIWELKTVRTLAGRGNCPNPMPELVTLVTPRQILSKPEGVPPVHMPFVGACRESLTQQMSTEESDDSVMPGTGDVVEVAVSDVDIIVETSQTDQSESKRQSVSPAPITSPTMNQETDLSTDVEQHSPTELGMTTEDEENVAKTPLEVEKYNSAELHEDQCERNEEVVAETVLQPLENVTIERNEPELSTEELLNSEAIPQQNSTPSPVNAADEEGKENEMEEVQHEEPQEPQRETEIHEDSLEVTDKSNTTGVAEETITKEPESKTSEGVGDVLPIAVANDSDEDYDVSLKTLDALLKELPPWRRKRGTVVSLPKRLRQSEAVVVGYVNGRPISASDRSLRRRSSNSATSPSKTPTKSSRNMPNKNSATDSKVDNEILDKNLPGTPMESSETTVNQQVKEPLSTTPSSPASKCLPKTSQLQKSDQNSLSALSDQSDQSQSIESAKELRSAGQKPAPSSESSLTTNAESSVSTPEPPVTQALFPPDHTPSLPLPSPPPVTSPVRPCSPAANEQSQQDTVAATSVELNMDKDQTVQKASEEIQKTESSESKPPNKLKLRSAKAVLEDSNHESQQVSTEVLSPLENLSQVKTEIQTQIMPLRSKRIPQTTDAALLEKSNEAPLGDTSVGGDDSSSISGKPTRKPLRSESSKSEISHQTDNYSPPLDNKKLVLRSQRSVGPSNSVVPVAGRRSEVPSSVRMKPERIPKAQVKPTPLPVVPGVPHRSVFTLRSEPPKQTVNKFFETLTGEESQHLITNLNIKYDKMQKGWLPLDKEGQPATKYKNKSDRQAAIWKSKRRARKAKCLEYQKYSPVQMLFMKGFNLSSICRWFLESTETKSLVIVKNVNTRLPSETQLCFHGSSNVSGSSQGIFPSVQAERLKKHLKKFAIASPVKSNPKSQKLIAKALEQEANAVKGKDRRELQSTATTQTQIKPHSSKAQIVESQKSSGKSKNPASARILRKYSNIREKMQVQQTNVRLKEASKSLRASGMKRLVTTKPAAKSNLKRSLKARKSHVPVSKQMRETAARMERGKRLTGKKHAKHPVQKTAVKGQSRVSRKELPKRCSQRLGSPKILENKPGVASKSRQEVETEKAETDKPTANKVSSAKIQAKESSQTTVAGLSAENTVEAPRQMDIKVASSPDQVLTRSQRRMEAAFPLRRIPSQASRKMPKTTKTQNSSPKPGRKAENSALSRRGALKVPAKRSRAASSPRNTTKLATKRTRELVESPAKRTRTSLLK